MQFYPGHVHVWTVDHRGLADKRAALESVLSPSERGRAQQFKYAKDRDRFALVRGALRQLAGAYENEDAARLALETEPLGRPYLPGHDLFFSVSHANNLSLIVFARARRVGVDLAWLDEPVDTESVARWLPDAKPGDDRRTAWKKWTIEEARRKAAGVGFAAPLPDGVLKWYAQELAAPDGFVASLVAEGPDAPRVSAQAF